MDDKVRQALIEIIQRYGQVVCEQPKRCEAFLRDYCPTHRKEIHALKSALKEDVATTLRNPPAGMPIVMLLNKLTQRLEDNLALSKQAAHWAVDSLAMALGVISTPRRKTVPPKKKPAIQPTRPTVSQQVQRKPDNTQRAFRDRLKNGRPGPTMVILSAGQFWMGDLQGTGHDSERPVHLVSLKRFALGRTLITFVEYDDYCKTTHTDKPSDEGWGRGQRPVINVSWHEAVAYCRWLTQQTGRTYRLLSEAEWEYAARAGSETDYWWGNEADARYVQYNLEGKPPPTNAKQPNPFGFYDMHGHIWEWCADVWHLNYQNAPTDGRPWLIGGEQDRRVLRGGSWALNPNGARSADRYWNDPANRFYNIGFRVAVSVT